MNDIVNKLGCEIVYCGIDAGDEVLPLERERKTNFFRVKFCRRDASLRASSRRASCVSAPHRRVTPCGVRHHGAENRNVDR